MIKCLNFSIVGLVKNHNPSILNPDFLEMHKIVPKEWERGNPPISIPTFAQVEYKNGVTIFAEPNKIQITDILSEDPKASKIQEIIGKYLRFMPTVSCTSVGMNFLSVIDMENDEKSVEYLKELFLKKDPWENPKYLANDVGFQFIYTINDVKLLVDIKHGSVITNINNVPSTNKGIILSANFEKSITGQSAEGVVSFLEKVPTYWNYYNEIVNKIKPL